MTVDDNDQVEDTETTEISEDKSGEEETDKDTEINQEDQDNGQSNNGKGEEGTEEKLYETPDGRKLTADQMNEEYKKLLPEFTRKSQALSKYEKAEQDRKAEAQNQAKAASSDLLKKVPADVKEAVTQIAAGLFDQKLKEVEEENQKKEFAREQQQRDLQFKEELTGLEKKYNGKNPEFSGIPKFDRAEVLKAMKDPKNKIFDPELKFMDMYKGKFLDVEIKKALKKQGGGNRTERTGHTDSKDRGSDGKKTPKTIAEASASFLARMNASE